MAAFANGLVEAGVAGLANLFARRLVTPVEATEAYLSRIDRLDPVLGAVLDLDREGARQAALAASSRWAGRAPASAVDGVPILVKANIAVAGLPWHAGVAAYKARIAAADAPVVARLRAAGAVILGTVNMHEGALGAVTDNPWFGRTHNPHAHGRTAGGSSGGSGAATAAGLCAAALGTDTMGSVRIPSAYCGVFGHKPARDLLSTTGVVALSYTLDNVGVHARSAGDCRELLSVAAGRPVAAAPSHRPLAWLAPATAALEPEVMRAHEDLLARARAAGIEIEALELDYDFGRNRRLGLFISEAEGALEHAAALSASPEGFSEAFRAQLAWGAAQPAAKLAAAHRDLRQACQAVRDQLRPYSGLLTPTVPQAAFPFGETPADQADFTAIANVAGLPATAFPLGLSEAGLPLSGQVIAWDDAEALVIAERLAEPVGAPPGFAG